MMPLLPLRALTALALIGSLAGTAQAQDVRGATLSVEDLIADRQTYERFEEECRNNPGELAFVPNCINTLEARKQIRRLEMREFIETK